MLKITHIYRFGFLQKALLFLGLFLALGTTGAFAQFAVTEDFRGAGNPDILIGDDAALTSGNVDPVNQGWLRLTPSETYKQGYAYINKSFPSTLGVLVDFEYKMWRSAADNTYNGADGIGVFLFDGIVDQSTFKLGGYGGSLGYAPKPGESSPTGLVGGYVGIGIDAYGNFANPGDGPKRGGPGERPNSIVMRGPTTGNDTNAVVGGVQPTNRYLSGKTITTTDGVNFTYSDMNTANDVIGIRTQNAIDWNTSPFNNTRIPDATYYRRIQIEIKRLTTGGQYEIIVRWKTSSATTAAFTEITRYTTTDAPPGLLKLGFAAATGGGFNFHEIRNLLTTTPNNMRVIKRANKDWLRGVTNNGTNASTTENQVQYTIEVTNDTDMQADNVKFEDYLTDANGAIVPFVANNTTAGGFYIESIVATGFLGNPTSASFTRTPNSAGKISHNTLSMAANSTAYITITGRLTSVPPGNLLVNTATVTPLYDTDMNNNTSVVEIPVIAEGTDVIPWHTVDEACSDGSNTFTLIASNTGTDAVTVGNANNSNRLRMVITIPTSNGFGYNANNINGWDYSGVNNNNDGTSSYTFNSNQSVTLNAGAVYNFPIVYTITKAGNTAYSTTATISYRNSSGNQIEPSGAARNNNSSTVNINSIPTTPTVSNVYYCQGATAAALTATKSNSAYDLKWYFSASGGFSSDFAPVPTTESAAAQSYWVSQVNGTCEGPRSEIKVFISTTPTEGAIAANQNICYNTPAATITSQTDGTIGLGARTYRWERSTNGGTTWGTITGATGATYSPTGNQTATILYRRYTVSKNGTGTAPSSSTCESPATNAVTISVSAVPTPGVIAATQTVCYNTAPTAITTASGAANAPTGTGVLTYKWEVSVNGGAWSLVNGVTTESYAPGALTVNTSYRRSTIATSTISGNTATCTSVVSNIVDVTVQGVVNAGSIAAAQTICAGATPTALTSTAVGSSPTTGAVISYRWESSTNAGGTWATAASSTNTTGYTFPGGVSQTTYYRRITISTLNGKACEAASGNVIITVAAPTPGTIGSSQTVCFGSSPTAFTTATGGAATGPGTLSYQWYYSFDNSNFTIINGATNESYLETATFTTNNGYYRRVTISTTNGTTCQSAVSNTITVTPAAFLGAGSIVDDNKTVCSGGTPTTIQSQNAGTGTAPITYAWQSSTDNTNWSGDILGATAAAYSPGPLTQTTWFRRYAIGTYNSGTTTCRSNSPANVVKVTVAPIATAGTIGNSQTVCNGTAPAQTVNVESGADTNGGYIWQMSTNNVDWTDITGANTTNSVYQPPVLTITTYYRRFGVANSSNVLCRGTVPSNVITITVPLVPSPGTIGSDQNVCANAVPALLTSQSVGTGSSYQWQSSNDGTNNWTNISGATAATYQPLATSNTIFYRRLSINNTCPSAGSNVVKITVNVYPNAGSISGTQTVCTGNTPATITGDSGYAGGGTGSYRWYSSPDGTTWTYTGTTTQNYVFTGAIAATTYYRRGLTSSPCFGEVYTTAVTITVATAPTGGSIVAAQTVCYGATPAPLTSTGAGSVANYRWDSSPTGAVNSWSSTGVTTAGYTFPAGLVATTYYRRATISTTCPGEAYSNTVMITVTPAVAAGTVAANQVVCYNTTPAPLTSTGAGATTNYRWDSSTDGNTWDTTGVTTAGYTFPAPLVATRYYRRATISGSCEGYTATITITVLAETTAGSISGDQNICMDNAPAAIGPGTAGSGAGTVTYKWEMSTNNGASWSVIAGANQLSYQPPVIHKTTQYRRTTVSTSVIGGLTYVCESATTAGTVIVTARNCKVITNPMIYQKVKN